MVITPTPGRIVWYYPHFGDTELHTEPGPLAAIVTKAWGDHVINLCVFGPDGTPHRRQEVPLVQPDRPIPSGAYAAWMPHQISTARGIGNEHMLAQMGVSTSTHEQGAEK